MLVNGITQREVIITITSTGLKKKKKRTLFRVISDEMEDQLEAKRSNCIGI